MNTMAPLVSVGARNCSVYGQFLCLAQQFLQGAIGFNFHHDGIETALFNSSCSKAEDMRSISLADSPIESAVSRQRVTALPTSCTMAFALSGFTPKCAATSNARSSDAVPSVSSTAVVRMRGLMST